ncbi:MAG: type II toxin-antitoxin system HicA family toxin [Akkermansiaceae bacterium]|nr:type II toxin-antitoxin system HicA family toxin [Akkermansiaceae bacterium]MCP5551527.1 type II toxin-antitoxin system HicA family toxin [Akkermansiaceae bacterium]
MKSREVIRRLKEDGWYLVGVRGDHHQFKNERRSGCVTVPRPVKDIPISTVRSIFRQAGWEWPPRAK